MQDTVIVKFTREEFEYIKTVLFNLGNVENKIPKSMKSRKSEILKELIIRFSNNSIIE